MRTESFVFRRPNHIDFWVQKSMRARILCWEFDRRIRWYLEFWDRSIPCASNSNAERGFLSMPWLLCGTAGPVHSSCGNSAAQPAGGGCFFNFHPHRAGSNRINLKTQYQRKPGQKVLLKEGIVENCRKLGKLQQTQHCNTKCQNVWYIFFKSHFFSDFN